MLIAYPTGDMSALLSVCPVHDTGSVVVAKGRTFVRWARVALFVAAVGLVGCAAEIAPAAQPPADYYYYPYTYYDGHIVYYVDGSWYYPYGNRWYYYRRVPPELAHRTGSLYRSPYHRAQAAPPAYRAAPPAYRAAPPAYRAAPPYGRGGGPPPGHHR